MAKEKRLGGCLKGFAVLVLLIVVGLAVLIGVTVKKLTVDQFDFDLVWEDKDYLSALAKAGTVIKGDITELDLLRIYEGSFVTAGSRLVDEAFTTQELCAVLNRANDSKGPVRNIKIKLYGEDRFELHCTLDKSLMKMINKHMGLSEEKNAFLVKWIGKVIHNKPTYIKGTFEAVSQNYIHIEIESGRIGKTPLREDALRLIESELRNIINKTATEQNGISIEKCVVKDGKLLFRGTLPEEIKGK